MQYSIQTELHYTIISLSGEVDLQNSPVAREQILSKLNNNHSVLVDLQAVKYIDSSGIASLVEAYQLAKSRKLEFALLHVSNKAMQVLELANLHKIFNIYDSIPLPQRKQV